MSREYFGIEKGIQLLGENAVTGVKILFGSGAPAIEAEIGSLYFRTDAADVYKKIDVGADASDWEILPSEADVADLITLSGVAANSTVLDEFTGTVLAADDLSVKAALQALATQVDTTAGNVANLITLSGVAADETDLGEFSGTIIPDDSDIKESLQALETAVDALDSEVVQTSANAIGADAVVLDEVKVDDYLSCEWLLTLQLDADVSKRVTMKVIAQHDGKAAADAVNVDDAVYAKLKLGVAFTHVVAVALAGSTTTQTMQLKITGAASAGVISARATRIGVLL